MQAAIDFPASDAPLRYKGSVLQHMREADAITTEMVRLYMERAWWANEQEQFVMRLRHFTETVVVDASDEAEMLARLLCAAREDLMHLSRGDSDVGDDAYRQANEYLESEEGGLWIRGYLDPLNMAHLPEVIEDLEERLDPLDPLEAQAQQVVRILLALQTETAVLRTDAQFEDVMPHHEQDQPFAFQFAEYAMPVDDIEVHPLANIGAPVAAVADQGAPPVLVDVVDLPAVEPLVAQVHAIAAPAPAVQPQAAFLTVPELLLHAAAGAGVYYGLQRLERVVTWLLQRFGIVANESAARC